MDKYKVTFETWNKNASLYQDKFMDLDLYNDTYDTFCRLIEKRNPHVFEIGCGPGNITKYLLSKRPDFKIEAIDIAPNMIELARKNNPTAEFKVMDCREIDKLDNKFDAIVCGFCMPYLSKEECAKLIDDCSQLLYANGVLYFSYIEDDYNKSRFETASSGDKAYVYYHQEDYLLKDLKDNGFKLTDIKRKLYTNAAKVTSTHTIFISKK